MLRASAVAFAAGLFLVACSSGAPISTPSAITPTATPAPTSSSTPPSTSPGRSAEPTQQSPTPAVPATGLFASIRADVLATDCQQIQGDLPPGLAEVVFCEVGTQLVDSVTFARYSAPDALLDFYEARLSEYGIGLATDVGQPGQTPEDCWRGYPSESFYFPAGVGTEANREGCFIDENGDAVQLYLLAGPIVLVTAQGRTADIAALKAWSWYDAEGGEPAAGGPGLWQPPA